MKLFGEDSLHQDVVEKDDHDWEQKTQHHLELFGMSANHRIDCSGDRCRRSCSVVTKVDRSVVIISDRM